MKRKKLLSSLLVLGITVTSLPMNVFAKTTTMAVEVSSTQELSEENLTKILTAVKKKINVPKEFSNFTYYYNAKSSYNEDRWNFQWRKEDGSGSISIESDKNANILSYYKYNDGNRTAAPKYLKSELKTKADSFFKQVASNIYNKTEYISANYTGGYNGTYSYTYTRVENGVPMPQQQIQVGVDSVSGEIKNFNSSWNYDITIPKKDIKITKEQATEKIRSQVDMNLVYNNRYTTDAKGNTTVKAVLVYEPSISYLAIDATSGKSYTTLSEWSSEENKTADNESAGSSFDTDSGTGGLTEVEIKKISELKELISKQKAIEIVTKNDKLYIDSSANIITASLVENTLNYQNKETKRYYWNIQLAEPKTELDKAYYSPYTSAMVDAKTGEIVSFNAFVKDYYYYQGVERTVPSVKYSLTQSQSILENFINSQNKDRLSKAKLSTSNNEYVINIVKEKEVYGGYSFSYDRLNEGVVYDENQIYGSVDGVTGKITSYGYYWDESVVFESPKGVITSKQAFDAYMKLDGYELVYELNTIMSETSRKQEARLVYRTEISPSFISAFTGKQINYDGSEYVSEEVNVNYTDIKGHKYNRSIQLIADMGAGIKGSKFNPDQAITKSELQQMVDAIKYTQKEDKITGTAKISRQEAALYSIKLLDLENVASISGIYKTGAADAASIGSSYIGAVALSKGLGILNIDNKNNFRPKANLTRAEAADMILKTLAVETY